MGWALTIGLVALLRLWPDLPISRLLQRHLVERPVAALLDMNRLQLIKLALFAALMLTAGDLVLMLGSSEMLLLYAGDLALYVDAVMVAYTVAAAARIRPALALMRRPVRLMKGKRHIRSAPQPTAKPAANDDDGDRPRWNRASCVAA
ncbi:MAG: hypothetical protein IE933_00340 [Sphingomonadales bacterium]|nr:hypothetical protein [Sphingomonadales bacterium]MBD3772773.1 hypothetical protein [Paracoccaceae bacterium]